MFFEEGCLDRNASIIRKVPLFYKRPNLTEMNRVYLQLVTVTLSPLDLSPSEPIPVDVPTVPEPTVPEPKIVSVPSASEPTAEQKEEGITDSFNPLLLEDACLKRGCSDDVDVNFWKAVSESNMATIRLILSERPHYNYSWCKSRSGLINRNEDGETPLHVATLTDNIEMVLFVLWR